MSAGLRFPLVHTKKNICSNCCIYPIVRQGVVTFITAGMANGAVVHRFQSIPKNVAQNLYSITTNLYVRDIDSEYPGKYGVDGIRTHNLRLYVSMLLPLSYTHSLYTLYSISIYSLCW
jgi:hypothetical protein